MTSESDIDLEFAAKRMSTYGSNFVGSMVHVWCEVHPDGSLPTFLTNQAITRLSLCLRPRAENWQQDVAEIAAATGLSASELGIFLRECVAIERLTMAHPVVAETNGSLLAARQREDDEP